jgi:hypothetical protein
MIWNKYTSEFDNMVPENDKDFGGGMGLLSWWN